MCTPPQVNNLDFRPFIIDTLFLGLTLFSTFIYPPCQFHFYSLFTLWSYILILFKFEFYNEVSFAHRLTDTHTCIYLVGKTAQSNETHTETLCIAQSNETPTEALEYRQAHKPGQVYVFMSADGAIM